MPLTTDLEQVAKRSSHKVTADSLQMMMHQFEPTSLSILSHKGELLKQPQSPKLNKGRKQSVLNVAPI